MKYAVYIFLFLVVAVAGLGWTPQTVDAQENQPGGPTESLPQNKRPPTKETTPSTSPAANFYLLPPSPTRTGKDVCGNPSGTTYGEGYRCPDLEKQEGPYITYKSPWEKSLTILAAILAVVFASIYAAFHWFGGSKAEEWAARNLIVILIIGSAVFILTAGYDDKQAAPLFGLLGSVVGYLFGRAPQEGPAGKTDEDTPQKNNPMRMLARTA
ncbi:hypothetical protein [Rhizobium binae]|uniref:hypothetical protein n=1 Tax=Rhizobium binae TaxID=1138190 RepID=UPI001C831AAC|nr:hypothetical protein [Rhizobium binae]MBX4967825.1 hypothetical protein [Rhizobium binae]